jgi:plasmid stabilization system protein ParE
MARRIEWSLSATVDLQGIADYIARDSRRYAASVVRKIRDDVRLLKRFPKRGAVVPELRNETIREVSSGNYRIIYRLTDQVMILGVVHGARDLTSLWMTERRPE